MKTFPYDETIPDISELFQTVSVYHDMKAFNPDEPRDEEGKWTDSGGSGGEGGKDSAAHSYFSAIRELGKVHNFDHPQLRLAEKGHAGKVDKFTPEEQELVTTLKEQVGPCKRGYCFMNAQRLAMAAREDNRLQYVKGLVFVHGVPLDHAWVELNGKVLDPTLNKWSGAKKSKDVEYEYWGIAVPKDEIQKHQLRTQMYAPLIHSNDESLRKKIFGSMDMDACGEAVSGDDVPTGTPRAHYSGPTEGPFKCSHCTHSSSAQWCDHPDVIANLGASGPEGKAGIHPDGCCSFFRSRGD